MRKMNLVCNLISDGSLLYLIVKVIVFEINLFIVYVII